VNERKSERKREKERTNYCAYENEKKKKRDDKLHLYNDYRYIMITIIIIAINYRQSLATAITDIVR